MKLTSSVLIQSFFCVTALSYSAYGAPEDDEASYLNHPPSSVSREEDSSSRTKKCACCSVAAYSNKEQQVSDWKRGHKFVCNALKELRRKAEELGEQSNIFLNEESSRVEVLRKDAKNYGLFAKSLLYKMRGIYEGDYLAFYYGDVVPMAFDSALAVAPLTDPYLNSVEKPAQLDILGRHDELIRSKPYLAAALANDGIMAWEDGNYLIQAELIASNGSLDFAVARRLAAILVQYAIDELSEEINHRKRNTGYDGMTLRAIRPIRPGEEILVAYGIQYWIRQITEKLCVRGYAYQAQGFLVLLSNVFKFRVEDLGPGYLEPIRLTLRDYWMEKMPDLNQFCRRTLDNFQGVIRGEPTHRRGTVFYSLQEQVGTSRSFLSASVNHQDNCKVMQSLVDAIRLRPAEEFVTENGGAKQHPLVKDFLLNRGKGKTFWMPSNSSTMSVVGSGL
jgi:hypothetical protein